MRNELGAWSSAAAGAATIARHRIAACFIILVLCVP
jgi:hypothetical protein